jgi:Leucine-rich repeat (LRR) protein
LSHNETVGDESLESLARLRKLRVLYLFNTAVAGSGLASLSGQSLEHLDLSHSPVTDDGLRGVLHLRKLRSLGLKNTFVTDQGLVHLAQLSNLKRLRLTNTDVSDEGLEQLHQLSSLEEVSLRGTNVTAKGVSRLAKALPECQVSANYGLGLVPDQDLLFPDGHRPTAVEIKSKLKERNIDCLIETDASRDGDPIISFRLETSTLGAQPILQLIRAMPDLELLSVQNSLADDALLEGLADCSQLNYLIIRSGRLSDDGLRHLQEVSSLREIEFHEQVFTENAVENLSKLQQLTALYWEESKLSDEARRALKSALPTCRLYLH